jgi:hypothetical protein
MSKLKRRDPTASVDLSFGLPASVTMDVDEAGGQPTQKKARMGIDTVLDIDDSPPALMPPPAAQPSTLKRSAEAALSDGDEGTSHKRRAPEREKESEGTSPKAKEATKAEKKKGGKVKGTKATVDDSEDDEEDVDDDRYLRVKAGARKKLTAVDVEFNKQFNKLKIVRPDLKAPKLATRQKVGWADRDLDEEELREAADWNMDASKSFFRIKTLEIPSREEREERRRRALENRSAVEDKWRGMPNFKAFRPVNGPFSSSL